MVLPQMGDEVRPDVLIELSTTGTTAATPASASTSLSWSGSALATTTV